MKSTLMASLFLIVLAAGAARAQNGPELDVGMSGDSASGVEVSLKLTIPPALQEQLTAEINDDRAPLPPQIVKLRRVKVAAPTPSGNPPPGFARDRMAGCFYMGAPEPADAYATWSGGCDAEGFTTGAGTLRYYYPTTPSGEGHRAIFEGTVVGGRAEGPGVSVLTNGHRLEANFRYGLAEGQGRWLYSNGGRYEGEFRSGIMTGHARISYSDGRIYEGAVVNWLPHGVGKMTRPDGQNYTGHFWRGLRHGQGTLVYPGGFMLEGLFSDGRPEGRARVNFADGTCLIGSSRDGIFDANDPRNRTCE